MGAHKPFLKTGDTRLDVVNRFHEIVNNPVNYPIFESNDDNAALIFYDLVIIAIRSLIVTVLKLPIIWRNHFVDLLKSGRSKVFTFADRNLRAEMALPETDLNAYGGLDGSDAVSG